MDNIITLTCGDWSADWYGRSSPAYVYGKYGTSIPALKNWEKMGNHPL